MDERIFRTNLRRMNRLAGRLSEALVQLRGAFPLNPGTFDPDALEPRMALFLDGFRARFSDLQDMIGHTMFKSLALMDEDEGPGRELTTRERVALIEKRGLHNPSSPTSRTNTESRRPQAVRLSNEQLQRIRDLVREHVPRGHAYEIRLFGSRTDDRARGGDVDLYLELEGLDAAGEARLRRRLRPALEEALDLPVDLVIQGRSQPLKLVSEIARHEGLRV